jgi:photosystem II stability/assembly factor-like uncharacterized protein
MKYTFSGLLLLLVALLFSIIYFRQLQDDPRDSWEQYLSDEYQKIPAPAGKPDMAALQNYYMTIDPELKRVPSERLYSAYLKTREFLIQKGNKISPTDLEWIETGSNMGGRTRAIMWDPNDTAGNKVWAGSVTGGLWYNNDIYDNSSEWQPVNDFWPGLSVSCIVSDPNDPMNFYAGTGEYQTARVIYRESSGVGFGIWKSTDGGETWDIIPSTQDFKYISDLKFRDEIGISVLYAGVVSGYYLGINNQSEPSDGLYRSANGGDTWQQVLPDIAGEELPYAPADLEIGPNGRIFVGTMKNLDGNGGAAILYSDLGLAGTWTLFDDYENIIQNDPYYNVPDRIIIACAPSNANRVYALVGAGWLNSTSFNYAEGRYILKSNNGGQSWTETNLPGGNPDWANLSWHAFAAAVSPTNSNKLYVGGLDIWKTTDGGDSWSKVSDWTLMYSGGGDDYVHCDQHVKLYKENSSSEMLLTNDGGIFFTENAFSNNPVFQEKNKNYNTLQFYTCAIYPVSGVNYFVGGLQDNGTLLYTGEPLDINDMIDECDGAYCFFDKTQPNIMITSTIFNVYKIFYNWEHYGDMGIDESGVFINPADYDSENNILYANAIKFNGSYPNQILRISGIPNDPDNQLISLPVNLDSYFSHIKVSPFGPDGSTTLFLGSQCGRLFRVNNAHFNPVVTEIGSDDFPVAYISSLAIGGSEDTLLVTFSNYGVPSVWQSYDGGTNWEDISGNLPEMPIRWSLYHPQNSLNVMLATEVGIWSTSDASTVDVIWEPDAGMPNVRIDMLQIRTPDNTVLAATHGRGLMYTTWNLNPSTSLAEIRALEVTVYPNPASDFIRFQIGDAQQANISIISRDGRLVYEGTIRGNEQIDVRNLPAGIYLITVFTEDRKSISKLVIY